MIGLYLASLSSSLIALAFIGQMSRIGPEFNAFALIVLPVVAFIGVVTFERLVQLSFEDIAYAERIGRLREFYVTVAPGLAPYVLVVRGPSAQASLNGGAARPTGWQLTLTTAGMIAVVNSVVVAACAGFMPASRARRVRARGGRPRVDPYPTPARSTPGGKLTAPARISYRDICVEEALVSRRSASRGRARPS